MERKTKAAAQTGIYLLIVAVILVVVNLISYSRGWQIDMTANEQYTLSKGSKRLVREGLKQPLQIDVYASKGLARNDQFITDLGDLLKEYEVASIQKDGKPLVTFTIIDPKTDEQKKAATDAKLQETSFNEASETGKDQSTSAKGFMGLVFKYGTEQGNIPYWPPEETKGLEFFITNQIRELRDTVEKRKIKIGIITGKDELKISDNVIAPAQGGGGEYNLKGIFSQYLPFYEFEEVDLQNGDAEINQELKGVIITQPQKDYTEKELRRIDQFLMLGDKSLVVMASAVNLKANDPSMRATLSTRGLEKLLDGYGVEMKKDAVFDWQGSFAVPATLGSGQQIMARWPWAVQAVPDEDYTGDKLVLDDAFAPFFRLKQVPIPFPSTLLIHKDKQPEARIRAVARTLPESTADVSESIDMFKIVDSKPTGEKGQKIIAVAIDGGCCDGSDKCGEADACKKGIVKSAFAGTADNMGVEAPEKSKGHASIFVLSSSEFLANPFARSGNPPPMPPQMQMMGQMGGDKQLQMIAREYYQESFPWMAMSFKNTLDWMGGEPDLVATSAKLLGAANLRYADVKKPETSDTDSPEDVKKKMDAYKDQRSALQNKVQWTLILLPSLLFLALGLFRWWRREAGRDSISV